MGVWGVENRQKSERHKHQQKITKGMRMSQEVRAQAAPFQAPKGEGVDSRSWGGLTATNTQEK
jgi:hypothetical protein